MNETVIQVVVIAKLLWIVGFSALYGFGGISNKWIRRYLGAVWITWGYLAFGYWLNNFSWYYAICAPLYILALSIGYGGEGAWEKVFKRTRYALFLSLASLPIVVINNNWIVQILHTSSCILFCVGLGVLNPFKTARAEETTIGMISVILPMMLI